jgi:hypothetical protein
MGLLSNLAGGIKILGEMVRNPLKIGCVSGAHVWDENGVERFRAEMAIQMDQAGEDPEEEKPA